jgi:hypothetical protein
MQIVKLSVPVPSIGPAVDVHVRTEIAHWRVGPIPGMIHDRVEWCAAYDRQAGAWVLPETPESVAELLAAAGVVLR